MSSATAFRWLRGLRLHQNGGPHRAVTNVGWKAERHLIVIRVNKEISPAPPSGSSPPPPRKPGPVCVCAARASQEPTCQPQLTRGIGRPPAIAVRLSAEIGQPAPDSLHRH